MDLPLASLKENHDVVKPILALGLTPDFTGEALLGHMFVRAQVRRCKTSAARTENFAENFLKKWVANADISWRWCWGGD